MKKILKWIILVVVIVLALFACVLVTSTINSANRIKDAQSANLNRYGDVSMEEVMDKLCTDVEWTSLKIDENTYHVDIEGKLRGGVPFLDGYEGAPVGFTIQVDYDEDRVESITLVDARFYESEYDIAYDMDWIVTLIYHAYEHMDAYE